MGTIGKDFKYKVLKKFLSKDEIDIFSIYCEIKHRNNSSSFDLAPNTVVSNLDTSFYADPLFESLMIKKRKIIETETGKELLPTYSFWRCYTKFSNLKKHTDRPSCEISVTLNIANDGTKWPIFIDGAPVHLDAGDALIYLGRELAHWREEFEGDFQIQSFLHYVEKNGKFKNYYRDQKPFWGVRI